MKPADLSRAGPPPSAGPSRHPITVSEYLRMGEAGIFQPEARCELIAGEIIDMPPTGPTLASKTARLLEVLSAALRGRASVWAQNPIVLGDLSAPQPDLGCPGVEAPASTPARRSSSFAGWVVKRPQESTHSRYFAGCGL